MTDATELIRQRVAEQIDEQRQRRARTQQLRAELNRRRTYAKNKINEGKLMRAAPERPPIQHAWNCPRSGGVVEDVRRLPTGQAAVVTWCVGCGGTDEPGHHLAGAEKQGTRSPRAPDTDPPLDAA